MEVSRCAWIRIMILIAYVSVTVFITHCDHNVCTASCVKLQRKGLKMTVQ